MVGTIVMVIVAMAAGAWLKKQCEPEKRFGLEEVEATDVTTDEGRKAVKSTLRVLGYRICIREDLEQMAADAAAEREANEVRMAMNEGTIATRKAEIAELSNDIVSLEENNEDLKAANEDNQEELEATAKEADKWA